jgi:hypothetical protein
MSKGFLIVGTRVTARRACSISAAPQSKVRGESTELLYLLERTWFKSRHRFGRRGNELAEQELFGQFARSNSPQLIERLARAAADNQSMADYYDRNEVRESHTRLPGDIIWAWPTG